MTPPVLRGYGGPHDSRYVSRPPGRRICVLVHISRVSVGKVGRLYPGSPPVLSTVSSDDQYHDVPFKVIFEYLLMMFK